MSQRRKETWVIPHDCSQLITDSQRIDDYSLAPRSIRTYESVLNRYSTIMRLCNREPYPIREEDIRCFVQLQIANKKTWSYVNMAIEAFVYWFRENHQPDVTKTVGFAKYKKGLRRLLNAQYFPMAKRPITKEMLEKWTALDDVYENQEHAEVMFAFMMMFMGFMRISEFTSLNWDDVEATPEGLEIVIRRSKTDQESKGTRFVLPKRCSLFDGKSWFAIYQVWNAPEKGTRLWRHTEVWLRNKIKLYVARIGEDERCYSCHSFRKGGANAAFKANVQDCVIKVHGRWRTEAYHRYTNVEPEEAARMVVMSF